MGGVGAGRARQRRPRRPARLRRGGRAAVRLRQGGRRPGARGRLPRVGPGHAALRPRLHVAAQGRGREPPLRRRVDADAHGRARRPPAADVARRDRGVCRGGRRRGRRHRLGRCDRSLRRGGRGGPEGAPRNRPRRRGRIAAALRACARARDQRDARQRREHGHLLGARGGRAARPGGVVRGARHGHGGGQGLDARHRRGQPGLHGARGPRLREGARQGRPAHPPRPLRRRDLASVPLARRGGASARGLERRARVRRHDHDPAAADRPALRRQVRPRAARGVLRPAREDRPRHRQGVLERPAARRRLRACLAQGPPRRARRGLRLAGQAGPGAGLPGSPRAGPRPLATHAALPPRSHHLGRLLRQQRLDAGARETAHEADLGERRAHRAVDRPEARPDHRGRRDAHAQRPQGRGARMGDARPGRGLRHRALRLRTHAGRPGRRRQGLRRVRAAPGRRRPGPRRGSKSARP